MLLLDHPDVLLYVRTSADKDILVISNFRDFPSVITIKDEYQIDHFHSSRLLLGNYTDEEMNLTNEISLKPFETRVYLLEKKKI